MISLTDIVNKYGNKCHIIFRQAGYPVNSKNKNRFMYRRKKMINKLQPIQKIAGIVVNQSKKPLAAWFAGAALIVLLVAFLVLSGRVTTASSKEIAQSFPLTYDATGAMLDAVVFPTYSDQRIQSPSAQYDATGAMLDAVVFSHQLRPAFRGSHMMQRVPCWMRLCSPPIRISR
jgi:hypothetical protein